MVGHHHVGRVDALVIHAVQRDPVGALEFAQLPGAVGLVRNDVVGPAVYLLRAAFAERLAQRQRSGRGGAEPDVGQPGVRACPHSQRQVRPRPHRLALGADAREQPVHGEPQPLERRAEKLAVLVAVAAAPGVHQLVLDGLQVHLDSAAEHDVEVLERDRRQVRPVQRGQHRLGRLGRPGRRPGVPDPGEIGVQIQLGDGPVVSHPRRSRPGSAPSRLWPGRALAVRRARARR